MNGKRSGFSLFEMLIVVSIIGVLALAAVPVAEISFVKTQETELQTSLDSIRQAIAAYRRDCRNFVIKQTSDRDAFYAHDSQFYPVDMQALFNPLPGGYNIAWTSPNGAQSVTFVPVKYLKSIPADPFVGAAHWVIHFASGTSTVTYQGGTFVPATPADHVGVYDISPDPAPANRRGFVTAIDGTNYADW
ncbi:MAG: type II secretion system protein [Candidatus Riflebacteria bacterium]